MRLGTTIAPRDDPARFAQRARDLERAGVDVLWTGEAYSADAVSTMGFLAAVTERAVIGSSILPLYSRSPALIAMTGLGLHKLASGRLILGIGTSGPQVVEGLHGVPYDMPLTRTREVIEVCRQLWRGDKVALEGDAYQIPLPPTLGTGLGKPLRVRDPALPIDVPIYVAALGPRNVELTAEIADGWLPIHFWPEKAGTWAHALTSGAARRSPERPPLEIVAGGTLALTEDPAALREQTRATLAFFFGGMGARSKNFYNELLGRYGYEGQAAMIQDAWLGGDKRRAVALVPNELVEGVTLAGPANWVRERVEALRSSGVTILNVETSGPNGLRDLEQVREWLS
jgi:F420-dependent oxidoreductase-like protein